MFSHFFLGEKYFLFKKTTGIVILDKSEKRLANKLIKDGYEDLIESEFDLKAEDIISKFQEKISKIKLESTHTVFENIFELYYSEGMCFFKTFYKGYINKHAIPITSIKHINIDKEMLDLAPTYNKMFSFLFFGDGCIIRAFSDNELSLMYFTYNKDVKSV